MNYMIKREKLIFFNFFKKKILLTILQNSMNIYIQIQQKLGSDYRTQISKE